MNEEYAAVEPTRAEIEALPGATLLEFGSPFCGHCLRAQPLLEQALAPHAALRHIKIADARGRRLGRSYAVKHWPTLVFLRDGVEVARVVRPQEMAAIDEGLACVASHTDAA
ncbi:unnamed protein product [Phaeothamnion confervicola]